MRGTPFYNSGFNGLDTRDAAYDVPQNMARDVLNMLGTTTGAMRKREGNITLATTAAPLLSLLPVEVTSTRYLIGQGGTAFYKIDGAGTVSTITGPTIPTSGARWSHIQAAPSGGQGPVYLMNGTDTPQQWTGTGNLVNWTATGTLPNGKYVKWIGNRVFVAGMTSYGSVADPGSTFVFSDIGNPCSWPASNVVTLDPNDGDQITGLGTFGPYLLVFKRRKVFVVYDLDTGANRRITDNTGCVAARSIVETPGGTYFLTLDKGVHVTDGRQVKLVSDIIRPTLENITPSLRANACAAFINNHYYLSTALADPSNPDYTLDYDTVTEGWWKHSFAAHQFAVWAPTNTQFLYAAPPASRVDRCMVSNTYTDNGSGFQAYWLGPWQSPSYFRRRIIQTPDYRKRLRQVRFDGSGKFSLYLSKDFVGAPSLVQAYDFTATSTTFGGGDTFGGGGTFGDPTTVSQGRAYSLGVARAFSLQWASDASYSGEWELENYELFMTDRTD